MNKKIFKPKYYKHIDKVLNIYDVIEKIKDEEYIAHHSFYPFLSTVITFKKYSDIMDNEGHHYKFKPRKIKYASHIDRCIYQWYSYKLNKSYNEYCEKNGLNDCSIAYRTCLKGMTNIEFSARAFEYVKSLNSCYILVSDFSDFFDKIEHDILKENLCEILNVNMLPDDWYKVYKSMTSYASVEKSEIESYLKNNGYETEESLIKCNSYFEKIKWSIAKKELHINKNKFPYGIPQGSPLSGIFANVYMIDFDNQLNKYVKSKNGMYMRYSDDLIVIIPKNQVESIDEIWKFIQTIKANFQYLEINESKTSGYLYENMKIKSLHSDENGFLKSGNFFCYLGFSFDGENIKFRDKTLTKFFYKLYRKVDGMVEREQYRIIKNKKRKSKIDKHRILKELKQGCNVKFINYVNHAKKCFSNEKYIKFFRKNVQNKVFIRFNKSSK